VLIISLKQALQAHQSKFERDMLLHHQNLTPGDAEYQKLLAAHKSEMEALEKNLNSEKERQKEALRKKVGITLQILFRGEEVTF
jgi:hypothetical protein